MVSTRSFLVAPIEAVLAGDPVIESRRIERTDLPGLAQLYVDAHRGLLPDEDVTIEAAGLELIALLNGSMGEPLEAGWLAIFEGWGAPLSAILCTAVGEMPVIVELLTDPAYRNRGFASSLVRDAARIFQADGATQIGIVTEGESAAAYLLDELGFSERVAAFA
jgi:ribosomal protein S18 acetylase RimI-like enzyme